MNALGQVTKVRVFIDRAAITRARTLDEREAQEGLVHFSPIPLDADTATFRAHVETTAGAAIKVTGVSWSVVYAERSNEKQREIKEGLERLDREMRVLDDAESAENHLESRLSL